MPFYKSLNPTLFPAHKRAVERLLALRKKLDAKMPRKTFQESIILGTWNIREFDSSSFGARLEESFFYIAEIIDRFDLIAIQEVREDLKPLFNLKEILGSHWDFFYTDVTDGTQGNKERMVFFYDNRKVRPSGLVGELVLPSIKRKKPQTGEFEFINPRQLSRTPMICGFKAGWTDFVICTTHIYYGEAKANDATRIEEIRELAMSLAEKMKDQSEFSSTKNLILMGDFNIFKTTDETFKAITDAGFVVPEKIRKSPSNVKGDKNFDQIALKNRNNKFELMLDKNGEEEAGVFKVFDVVFKEEDAVIYDEYLNHTDEDGQTKKYDYKAWRTYQMSDHFPMWLEIRIDFSDEYLTRKLNPTPK